MRRLGTLFKVRALHATDAEQATFWLLFTVLIRFGMDLLDTLAFAGVGFGLIAPSQPELQCPQSNTFEHLGRESK